MQSISNDNGTLFYSKFGMGKKVIFAFHGYGQDHKVFESFAITFNTIYTVYSFDIFFHGKSNWVNDEQPITKVQWAEFLSLLIEKENINSFEVIGYSMGGKFALATLECFPIKCDRVLLLAPDGVKMNFWYEILTQYAISRYIFRYNVRKPVIYSAISKVAAAIKLAPKKLIDFADSLMQTKDSRTHVYNTWVIFRNLYTPSKKLSAIIGKQKTVVHVFIGLNDTIVKPKEIRKILPTSTNITIHTINSGHGKLINETIRYIQTYNYIIH